MKTLTNMWNPSKEKEIPSQVVKQSFPNNTEEAKQFQLDISKAIYSPRQLPHMLQMLEGGAKQGKLPGVVGHVAASVVTTLLQRRAQESGRKVHIKLLFFGLRNAIMAIADIVNKAGIAQMTQEDIQQAVEIAGQSADQLINQPPQPGPEMPQQQMPQQVSPAPRQAPREDNIQNLMA